MNTKTFKILILISLMLIIFENLIGQSDKNMFEITPYALSKYFYWGEYNDYSIQIIEEEGLLYGGGISTKIKFSTMIELYSKIDADFYYGLVNYNGFLQDSFGNAKPYKSESEYTGLETTLNFGYDIYLSNHFALSPEFGFQYEYWKRDMDNGGQYGYDEFYNLFFIDFGANLFIPLANSSKIFLLVMGEYPLFINETIDLASRGQGEPAEINLEPKPNIGINIELGAILYRVFISVYIDYMIFTKSFFDQGYYQPESDRSKVGLKLGYTF